MPTVLKNGWKPVSLVKFAVRLLTLRAGQRYSGWELDWPPGGVSMQLQLIAALIIVFLIVVFAVQNAVAVSVVFFFWRVYASLSMVIATCFNLGILIGALLTVPTMLRERLLISRLRKQVETLRAENDYLREPKKNSPSAVSDL